MARLNRFSLRPLFMLSVALAAVVSLHAQRPSFRSAIDLVMLNVTVTGPGGRYVADLSGDDFQVFEDGRPQEVAYFSPANVPLSVSLVLDTSSSMDERNAAVEAGGDGFHCTAATGRRRGSGQLRQSRRGAAADDERSGAVGGGDSAHACQRIDGPLQRCLYRVETA